MKKILVKDNITNETKSFIFENDIEDKDLERLFLTTLLSVRRQQIEHYSFIWIQHSIDIVLKSIDDFLPTAKKITSFRNNPFSIEIEEVSSVEDMFSVESTDEIKDCFKVEIVKLKNGTSKVVYFNNKLNEKKIKEVVFEATCYYTQENNEDENYLDVLEKFASGQIVTGNRDTLDYKESYKNFCNVLDIRIEPVSFLNT